MIVPTVFVGPTANFLFHWEMLPSQCFQDELLPEYCSYEVIDEYFNVLSAARLLLGMKCTFGLRLMDSSFELVKTNNLYLKGDSMGIAWLLGAICVNFGCVFPKRLLAWGSVRPIRNGGFKVYPTSGTDQKIGTAINNDFDRVAFPARENHHTPFANIIPLPTSLTETFNFLKGLIYE